MTKKNLAASPEVMKKSDERHAVFTAAGTVESGMSSKYWLELIPYMRGNAGSVWIFVNGDWKYLYNPN